MANKTDIAFICSNIAPLFALGNSKFNISFEKIINPKVDGRAIKTDTLIKKFTF